MMEFIVQAKMQLCLLAILFFASYLYIIDGRRLNRKTNSERCNHYFDFMFVVGELAIALDGITAYTVNNQSVVPEKVNIALHLAYLLMYQTFVFLHFMYWLSITDSIPKSPLKKALCYIPITLLELSTIIFIPKMYFKQGVYTNYAHGIPAYTCFGTIALYGFLTLVTFIIKRNYIQKRKRTAFILSLSSVCTITIIQLVYNEVLIASLAVILVILSIYFCMENPTIKFLEFYHYEMVMGFATLVEGKDDSTGGHIRRSSGYAVAIANKLRKNHKYEKIINKDFILNLKKAAPMHDIGKICVPDNILQKAGKLTDQEFEIIKKHPDDGGRIIKETFGHLDDDDYEDMTYKVAVAHHEKWNGKGYPNHLSGEDIPLCARIMAVADVFDAVSAKRCYRDALPLETCFKIISDGNGTDFDPDVVQAFFLCQSKIESILSSNK